MCHSLNFHRAQICLYIWKAKKQGKYCFKGELWVSKLRFFLLLQWIVYKIAFNSIFKNVTLKIFKGINILEAKEQEKNSSEDVLSARNFF